MATRKKLTPGQQLWLSIIRSDAYEQHAAAIVPPVGAPRTHPQRSSKKWLLGMSRSLKEKFAAGLRKRREALNLTQQQLANRAGLTSTAVAMIEREERVPNVDTAARLCWALDMAAGLTRDDL
jgi:DNA-binding XRE family transcriptional regulator